MVMNELMYVVGPQGAACTVHVLTAHKRNAWPRLPHTVIQLQFPGTVPEKDLRLLCTLCFLETDQKPYRETGAK